MTSSMIPGKTLTWEQAFNIKVSTATRDAIAKKFNIARSIVDQIKENVYLTNEKQGRLF